MNRPSEATRAAKLGVEAAATAGEAEERDPAWWLRRVCQQCGSMADADPPTSPACHAAMPAG